MITRTKRLLVQIFNEPQRLTITVDKIGGTWRGHVITIGNYDSTITIRLREDCEESRAMLNGIKSISDVIDGNLTNPGEGEAVKYLKEIVDYIDKEGPAAKEWEAISHLCEKAKEFLSKHNSK